jgi:hypothetical protein
MPNITIPDIVCRTTSDGPGHAHGLAAGSGTSLDEALSALRTVARVQAEEIAGEYRGGEHAARPDAEWAFEVVGVRIVIGPEGSPHDSWVAYGTLCSGGANHWAASFWDHHS